MPPSSRKEALLAAAYAVVEGKGGAALTLDAVAAEAGLSKGGVLYHFPTKEALIVAMIQEELDSTDRAVEAALAAESAAAGGAPRPGAFARAYVKASFAALEATNCGLGGLLAAIANDPAMLDGYRSRTRTWRGKFAADGLDPMIAEIVRLTTDSLFYSDLIDAAMPSREELPVVKAALLALIETGVDPDTGRTAEQIPRRI